MQTGDRGCGGTAEAAGAGVSCASGSELLRGSCYWLLGVWILELRET
jgi:hypothetical protein